jgi:hypothetical protein
MRREEIAGVMLTDPGHHVGKGPEILTSVKDSADTLIPYRGP